MTDFKKNFKWMLVFLLLALIALLALLLHGQAGKGAKNARIIQDGKVIRTIDLQTVWEPYEFEVAAANGGYNVIRVEPGKIGIVRASCPDKICVGQGFIENSILPVVCLPNRLSVVIADDGNSLDAVTGGSVR